MRAVSLHGHADDTDQGQHRGLFEAGGGGDADTGEHEVPSRGQQQGHDDEGDHQGVAVRTADEVHHDERVEHAEPHRAVAAHAEPLGEAWHRPGHQAHGDQGREAHHHRGDVGVVARDGDDEVLYLEREWAVGRRREQPKRVDLVTERAGHVDRTDLVGVHALDHDLALSGVAVGVAAEQGWGQQHRQAPQQPGESVQGGTAGSRPQSQPGVDQQGHARHQQQGGGETAGSGAQPLQLQARDEWCVFGQERRRERAGCHQGHTQRAATGEGVGPGRAHLSGQQCQPGSRGDRRCRRASAEHVGKLLLRHPVGSFGVKWGAPHWRGIIRERH